MRLPNSRTDGAFNRWLLVCCVLAPLVGFLLFPGAGRDDKYITFWPAHTLVELGEMVNYNGQRVEQSSTLLFVILLALVHAITGVSVPMLGWVLGIAAGVASVAMAGVVGRRLSPETGKYAMAFTATSTYFTYWTFGGMEPPLVGLTSLLLLGALQDVLSAPARPRSWGLLMLAAAAFVMVRPESPLVLGGTSACILLAALVERPLTSTTAPEPARRLLSAAVGIVAVAALSSVALVVFRQIYFNSWAPQPVEAKAHHSSLSSLAATTFRGINYVLQAWTAHGLVLLAFTSIALFLLKRGRQLDAARTPLISFAVVYAGFIVLAGGEGFEGARFVAHLTPVLAILSADAVAQWIPTEWRLLSVRAVVAFQLGSSVLFAATSSISLPLWKAFNSPQWGKREFLWIERINREHRRDTAVVEVLGDLVARLPDRALSERPHVLAHNLGLIMYYVILENPKRLATIDLHGLSDRYVTDSGYREKLGTSTWGLNWTHLEFLRAYPEISRDTGVPMPDLMFWMNFDKPGNYTWPEKYGFRAYLEQRGRSSPPPTEWFAGKPFKAAQTISLSDSLRKATGTAQDYLYLNMNDARLESGGQVLESIVRR
jgi:hypothetical protein